MARDMDAGDSGRRLAAALSLAEKALAGSDAETMAGALLALIEAAPPGNSADPLSGDRPRAVETAFALARRLVKTNAEAVPPWRRLLGRPPPSASADRHRAIAAAVELLAFVDGDAPACPVDPAPDGFEPLVAPGEPLSLVDAVGVALPDGLVRKSIVVKGGRGIRFGRGIRTELLRIENLDDPVIALPELTAGTLSLSRCGAQRLAGRIAVEALWFESCPALADLSGLEAPLPHAVSVHRCARLERMPAWKPAQAGRQGKTASFGFNPLLSDIGDDWSGHALEIKGCPHLVRLPRRLAVNDLTLDHPPAHGGWPGRMTAGSITLGSSAPVDADALAGMPPVEASFLTIAGMPGLGRLPAIQARTVTLKNLPDLASLGGLTGVFELDALDCPRLRLRDGFSASSKIQLRGACAEVLPPVDCPHAYAAGARGLRRAGAAAGRSLYLSDCPDLEEIAAEGPLDALAIKACPRLARLPDLRITGSGLSLDETAAALLHPGVVAPTLRLTPSAGAGAFVLTPPTGLRALYMYRARRLPAGLPPLELLFLSDCVDLEALPDDLIVTDRLVFSARTPRVPVPPGVTGAVLTTWD